MPEKNVVLLVDNKQRDLLVSSLIAHHLDSMGIACHLEPLEAWQGVLAAHRPDMIIFNHLTAPHLVRYSKRLADIGVLTAVLTNEGITYERPLLKFIVGSHHSDAHIDFFFSWNEEMKSAMDELGLHKNTKVEVVGIPRFDFYSRPWSRMFENQGLVPSGKPKVLFCTNFAYAEFVNLPDDQIARRFVAVKEAVPLFANHRDVVETPLRSRLKALTFLDAIACSRKFHLIVRPHPYEKLQVYQEWLDKLPPEAQGDVTLDKETNITPLILNSDLQISCETCTTALEAWIAFKPTIELVLERHPIYFHEEHAALNPLCDKPGEIVPSIDRELAAPDQSRFAKGRKMHLKKWCNAPDGTASLKVATLVAQAVKERRSPDWSKLGAKDHRRGMKLKALRGLGLPYNHDFLLPIKSLVNPNRYTIKRFARYKTIRPGDVQATRQYLEKTLAQDRAEREVTRAHP